MMRLALSIRFDDGSYESHDAEAISIDRETGDLTLVDENDGVIGNPWGGDEWVALTIDRRDVSVHA